MMNLAECLFIYSHRTVQNKMSIDTECKWKQILMKTKPCMSTALLKPVYLIKKVKSIKIKTTVQHVQMLE